MHTSKTLVIVAHPNLDTSVINSRWMQELAKYPERYTIHDLYKEYPDGQLDVEQEQRRIEAHGNLVLQFPIYWFSSPPLLKKWLDEVLTYGWAYGSQGDKLTDRKLALAVTAGVDKDDYHADGKYGYTLEQILLPFQMTADYCKADYKSFFAFYGTEKGTTSSEVAANAEEYIRFLNNL